MVEIVRTISSLHKNSLLSVKYLQGIILKCTKYSQKGERDIYIDIYKYIKKEYCSQVLTISTAFLLQDFKGGWGAVDETMRGDARHCRGGGAALSGGHEKNLIRVHL